MFVPTQLLQPAPCKMSWLLLHRSRARGPGQDTDGGWMPRGCEGPAVCGVGRLVPLGHAAKPGLLYLCLRQPCHSSIASTVPCPADTSHLCLWRLVPSRGASASPAAGNGSLSWVLKGAARHCCAPGPLQRSAGVLAPGAPGAGAWGGPRLVPVSVPEGRCCL